MAAEILAFCVGYNIIIYQAIVVTVCYSFSVLCEFWAGHTHDYYVMGFTDSI